MCGRFALYASEHEIVSHFSLKRGFYMQPRYNIAPSQTIPVIMNYGQQIEFCRWGFIPAWQQKQYETPVGHMNARWESLAEKPTFKQAFSQQRCLIPASGYFEWKTINAKKQPFYVQLTSVPLFAFAGLWSSWQSANNEMIISCAIITAPAPTFLQKLHERMPVIVRPENYSYWLAKENTANDFSSHFLTPQQEAVKIFPVSSRMNHPLFEAKECIQSL